jgi:hypothetical protein
MAQRREPSAEDVELLRFFSQCFDRPAFQDRISQEGSMEDFDKAIEDTITAINTGSLLARDGQVLATAKGKSFLRSNAWRSTMDNIADCLREIRTRYGTAVQTGQIQLGPELTNGDRWYYIKDDALVEWFDAQRAEIIEQFNGLCAEAGIHTLRFPRSRGRHGY